MTIVNASDIFGKFFDVKFFILENVIPQMPLSGIYAIVNQVTLGPKEIIHMFVA